MPDREPEQVLGHRERLGWRAGGAARAGDSTPPRLVACTHSRVAARPARRPRRRRAHLDRRRSPPQPGVAAPARTRRVRRRAGARARPRWPGPARPAGAGCAGRAAPARPPTARRSRRAGCGGTAARSAARPASVSRVTAAPSRTSLWPARYFVTECTTTSAPSSSGRWQQRSGEGVVDDDERAALVRGGDEGRQVGDLEHRVGRRLEPEQVGAVAGPRRRRRCR